MTSGDEVQLVVFRVGSQAFALNIFQVERVLRYQEATPVPGAPPFLDGVFPHGDRTIPLMDLRKRFGEPARVRDDTRVIVLSQDDGGVGIVVDAVLAVRKVAAEEIVPPSPLLRGLAAECVQATVTADRRTIVLLAAGRLLTTTEQVALRDLLVEAPG
jgi:purine-binding chemotaxis protein CheW